MWRLVAALGFHTVTVPGSSEPGASYAVPATQCLPSAKARTPRTPREPTSHRSVDAPGATDALREAYVAIELDSAARD